MSEMLLLGAGASVEAGVPGVYQMSQDILARFRKDRENKKYGHVLSFVIGGLLFEAGQKNRDPLTCGVNVEELFNAVQLLADRHTLEAAPFVGSWHAMVDEFDKIYPTSTNTNGLYMAIYKKVSHQIGAAFGELPSGFESRKIDDSLASAIKKRVEALAKKQSASMSSSDSVGKAVEAFVKEVAKKWSVKLQSSSTSSNHDNDREMKTLIEKGQAKSGMGRIFEKTNERMIVALKDLVWISSPTAVDHLRPILNLLRDQKRLVIATLNYDNGVELVAQTHGVACETGIEAWSEAGSFDFPGDGLYLLKLHGSIDWTWDPMASSSERLMPHSVIRRVPHALMMQVGTRPAVIFGHRNKLTAEGPFLDLLRAFRQELSRCSTLTVVGYSFRDPHINVYISQWLNADRGHYLRIVNGPNLEKEVTKYVAYLIRLRDHHPEQVQIIGCYAGSGLLKLYGTSDGATGPSGVMDDPDTEHSPARD